MKTCTKCKEEKPLSEYHIRKDRGNKPVSQCKSCRKYNRGIGYLQDNADIVDAASDYLRRI